MRRRGQRLGVEHQAFGLALQQSQHQRLVPRLHADGVAPAGHGNAQALTQKVCAAGMTDGAVCTLGRKGARGVDRQRAFEAVVAVGADDGVLSR